MMKIMNHVTKPNKSTYRLWVLIYAFILIILTLSITIIFDKHLSADGVHYFVLILETQTFTYVDWTRQFANYISQILLVLAVNLGIKDLNSLSMLFGISLLLPYFLAFLLSLFALRGEDKSIILFALISMITINLTSDFVLIGEHHLLTLLSWPILFFLLRRVPLVSWDVFFLFGLMFLYTRLYSTAVVPAAFFMFIALFRVWYAPLLSQKIYYSIAATFSMVAASISIYSILYPRSLENKEGFAKIIMQSLYTPEIIASIFFLVLFFAGWFFRQQILVWAAMIPIILFAIYTGYTDYAITAIQSFENRSLALTLLPPLLLMATILHWKQREANRTIYIVFLGFVLIMLFSNILNTMKWNQFRHQVINVLQEHKGFIHVEDTPIATSPYSWFWTNSLLSVVWSNGCVKTVILNGENIGWEPPVPPQEFILKSYVCYSNTLRLDYQKHILFNSSKVVFAGWSHPEKDHMWSLNKKSKIIFSAIKQYQNLQGLLSLHIGTLGEQKIKVTINDKYIGSQKVNGWNKDIQFKFDPEILNKNQVNIIKFEFPNAHKPNNGDPRVLAMALKSFMIE